MFRPTKNDVRLVEYIVVPDAPYSKGKLGEPIMTLQQDVSGGQWDIPFWRMNGLGLRQQCTKERLRLALNTTLTPPYQLEAKAVESWAPLPYKALENLEVRTRFLVVLSQAVQAARLGASGGAFSGV